MSNRLCKLVGKHLVRISTGQKELTTELAKNGVILALFFCTPETESLDGNKENICTRLTNLHKEMNQKGVPLEIIQIPVEGKVVAFEHELPFLTLDSEHAEKTQGYLVRKYGVQFQNPTPVILIDSTFGDVINFQGREKLFDDPKGTLFPWRYPKCSEILNSGHLLTFSRDSSSLETVDASRFKDCIIGIYFGAFWCPAARTFVPHLIDIYRKINSKKKTFEIIFVSSDRSQESFERFFSTMPFLSIPYSDSMKRECLTQMYNIKAIPSLCIIGSQDNVITLDGRSEVNEDPEGEEFPWHSKLVDELRDKHSTVLNHELCVIFFLGNDESEYEQVEGVFNSIATQNAESDIEEAMEPKFFISSDSSELSESLRIFIDLEESSSHLVIMDIPQFRYAVASNSSIHEEKFIREFLRKFQVSHNQIEFRKIHGRFI